MTRVWTDLHLEVPAEYPNRTAKRVAQTRKNLLDKCREVLLDDGPGEVTGAAIADQADVAIGTLYNYFDTVELLIREVIRLDVVEPLERLAASASLADPRRTLMIIGKAAADRVAREPHWGVVVARLLMEDERARATAAELISKVLGPSAPAGPLIHMFAGVIRDPNRAVDCTGWLLATYDYEDSPAQPMPTPTITAADLGRWAVFAQQDQTSV